MTEFVKIEIDLSCNFWNYNPFNVAVMIDDKEIFNNKIEEKITIKSTADLDDGNHTIQLKLSGKTDEDTVIDDKNESILKDVILNVHDIRFDDISVGKNLWSNSSYYPDLDRVLDSTKHHVNLGLNGIWKFNFETPVYIWLLENLD